MRHKVDALFALVWEESPDDGTIPVEACYLVADLFLDRDAPK